MLCCTTDLGLAWNLESRHVIVKQTPVCVVANTTREVMELGQTLRNAS